jgi:hypothetical protein
VNEVCQCGQPHVTKRGGVACTGHISGKAHPERAGEPCGNPPRPGQRVCRYHGGSAPQAVAAAEERLERAAVEKLARTFGEPVRGMDPGEIVAEQIAWRYGHVAWLRGRVQALDPAGLVWGASREKIGGGDYGVTKEAKPNAWLTLYLEACRDVERLCIDAIRAGLEERRVKLAERDAEAMVSFLDRLLTDLGHDVNDPKTAGVVERHLRLVGE